MDDDKAETRRADFGESPASTVVVRWWCEQPRAPDSEADRSTRGTVLDLHRNRIADFSGVEGLVALLRRLIADARRRS